MSRDSAVIHSVSAANYHELGQFEACFLLLQEGDKDTGGTLLYSNKQGCGGDRTYSDGGAMIFVHGEIMAQGCQFSHDDVEVVTVAIDLDKVEAYRTKQHPIVNFFGLKTYSRIKVEFGM
jgi:hypothetical protein